MHLSASRRPHPAAPTGAAATLDPSTSPPTTRSAQPGAAAPQFLIGLVLALAVALAFPFDTKIALLDRTFTTSVEWLLVACLAAAAWHAGRRLAAVRPDRLTVGAGWRGALPGIAVAAAVGVSAAFAPTYRDEAASFALRFVAGLLLMAAVSGVVTSPRAARMILWGITGGAGLAAVAAVGEWFGWPVARALLAPWRAEPWDYVGVVRAAGTLPYPTIAAAYLGVTVPLALALAATTPRRSPLPLRLLPTAVAALCTVGTVATLTRGAVLALTLTLVGLLVLGRWLPAARPYRGPALATLAALALALGVVLGGSEVTRTRFVYEHHLAWYGADYAAPPAAAVLAGETAQVEVTVTNRSALTWTTAGPYPFVLGHRWLSADGSLMLRAPVEVPLPRDVAPGATLTVPVRFPADLPPGQYRLDVGMLHHRVSWFRHAGVADVRIVVGVEPSASGAVFPDPFVLAVGSDDRPDSPPAASRAELWWTALALFRDHPWLGIGPDNFRFVWSAYLGRPSEGAWFHGLYHAHNQPLELLADTGLAGTLAAGWFLLARLRPLWRRSRGSGRGAVIGVGLLGGVAAYLLHSQFDCFWAEPSVSTLVWLCLGVAGSPGLRAAALPEIGRPDESAGDEHANPCPTGRPAGPLSGREERPARAA